MRREIEAGRRRKQSNVKVSDLVNNAQALPNTLKGPARVHLPGGQVKGQIAGQKSEQPAASKKEPVLTAPGKKQTPSDPEKNTEKKKRRSMVEFGPATGKVAK